MAISLDVTLTGDTPKSRPMAVRLGAGPAVKIKDSSLICHPRVKNLMIDRAEEAGIPYQLEVLEAGGTDTGSIHLSEKEFLQVLFPFPAVISTVPGRW